MLRAPSIALVLAITPLFAQTAPAQQPQANPKPYVRLSNLDVPTLQKRANAGVAAAEAELGYRYQCGCQGIAKQNMPEAIALYKRAAAKNDPMALNDLGYAYMIGNGVPKNYAQAFAYLTRSADLGFAPGQNLLGLLYQNGWGVPQNYALAVENYLHSAAQGDDNGENDLGNMYLNGQGIAKNTAKALAWFQKAAAQGNATAEDSLGYMYLNAVGVPIDYAQATAWYQKAADQGDATGEYFIGYVYSHGMSGAGNKFDVALASYQKAAAQGNADAEFQLGELYRSGNIGRNLPLAASWYQKAAAHGNTQAMQALAQRNGSAQQPAPVSQPAQASPQQGICSAVYITSAQDETYGTHEFYGAGWSAATYNDALATANSELLKVANGIDPRLLPGGQYGPKPEPGSGCTSAHGAVAGKLKIAPSGSSMFNASGAAGAGPLGPGIYDIIAAGFADTPDAAVSAAMSKCQSENGPGDNDHEVCAVLSQW